MVTCMHEKTTPRAHTRTSARRSRRGKTTPAPARRGRNRVTRIYPRKLPHCEACCFPMCAVAVPLRGDVSTRKNSSPHAEACFRASAVDLLGQHSVLKTNAHACAQKHYATCRPLCCARSKTEAPPQKGQLTSMHFPLLSRLCSIVGTGMYTDLSE